MSSGEYCGNCGGKLVLQGQVCAICGANPNQFKKEKPSPILHYFFFIPYLVVEFWGFYYSLDKADLKGGGEDAFSTYIFLRFVLLMVTFFAYTYGRKADSSALRTQGGCLGIFNLLFLLVLVFLIIFN